MRRAFSSCRLYSWMRLICESKIVSGSTDTPEDCFSQSRKAYFGFVFRFPECQLEILVLGERFELLQLAEVRDPPFTDRAR